jgi:MFS family permease
MILNLFNGAGALAGPLIGGYLVSLFPNNKVLYSWMIVSAFIAISLGYFLFSFNNFDDGLLIGKVGKKLDLKALAKIVET